MSQVIIYASSIAKFRSHVVTDVSNVAIDDSYVEAYGASAATNYLSITTYSLFVATIDTYDNFKNLNITTSTYFIMRRVKEIWRIFNNFCVCS